MNSPIAAPPYLDRISDYARYYAERTPHADAVVLGARRTTYLELADSVDRIAKALLAAGVRRGDRVATLSTPHPDYFLVFLATCSIGAIWVGLNPRYTRDEYQYILGDSEPEILFARRRIEERDYSDDLDALRRAVGSIRTLVLLDEETADSADGVAMDEFLRRGEGVSPERLVQARSDVDSRDAALIVYTSGSTGRPKGALLPHRGLVTCSIRQMEYWACSPLVFINYLPINHIGCVGDLSCFSLVSGGTMVFVEKFDPALALRLIEQERVTWLAGVPTALQMLISHPDIVTCDVSSVQLVIWSGAAAPRSLIDQLLARFPRASSSYGLTETVGSVTFVPPCRDVARLADTVGHAVPGYDVGVTRADGQRAAPGEEGEIVVRGDFIMNGYWRRPEATAAAIDAEGNLHTGDLAVVLPDGAFRLVGRMKEMFISGGYNVFPREVERAIEEHPAIAMAAVIPSSDPLYGEVGVAYALLERDTRLEAQELEAFCRGRLANYKVPKRFVVAAELPMLPIGKIDKGELRRRVAADSINP